MITSILRRLLALDARPDGQESTTAHAAAPAETPTDPDRPQIEALQRDVLAALRDGCAFFTAHKEGGTHIFFDGRVFVRSDYGDQPARETYASDRALLAALRRFFDGESRRDAYPDRPAELAVWMHIHSRLSRARR